MGIQAVRQPLTSLGPALENLQRQIDALARPVPPVQHLINGTGEPAFLNGYANVVGAGNAAAGFYHLGFDTVCFGLITGPLGSVAFNLPFAPADGAAKLFSVRTGANALGVVLVSSTGGVAPQTGTNTAISLDGVRIVHTHQTQ